MTDTTDDMGFSAASQVDLDTWRVLRKSLKIAMSDRGFDIGTEEASLITRLMLEQIETSGLRIVPMKPTTEMQLAIKHALDQGKRMSVAWVNPRIKQRWRYQAAVDAAPSWRRGELAERAIGGKQAKA